MSVRVLGEQQYVACPFCQETDFDLIGLRHHLQSGYCDVYDSLPPVLPPRPAVSLQEGPTRKGGLNPPPQTPRPPGRPPAQRPAIHRREPA